MIKQIASGKFEKESNLKTRFKPFYRNKFIISYNYIMI